MISAQLGLAEIDSGFAALKRGETVRGLVIFGGAA